MVESPQRIWIEAGDECPYFYEADELHDVEQDVIEYVRADLYAALEAELVALEAAALARAEANAGDSVAVLEFARKQPGNENEMPRVISCNWLPDGQYEVYTHPVPQPSGPVGVKLLEWEERVGVDGTFDAYTSIGHYIATITDDDRGMWFAVGLTQSNYCAPDIDIVKAAAQADYERRIFSAITAGKPEQTVPSGWKLVPEEPTEAMLAAYWAQTGESEKMRSRVYERAKRYYRVMLSAAPAAPTAGGGDAE